MQSLLHRISRLDAHHRLWISLGICVVTGLLLPADWLLPVRITLVWVAFAFPLLLMLWITINIAHPRDLPRMTSLQDSSRALITLFVLTATVASLFSVIALLDSMPKHGRIEYVLLAVFSVACSWTLVHTIFTMRYAHFYYDRAKPGGLDFPDDDAPDYLDFAYYSFVVGMTSQVSDVNVQSKRIRRLTLWHGLLSFVYNVNIIALTISGISGILMPN